MEKDEKFGNFVKNNLLARDWSQSDLARRTGISQGSISRMLSGKQSNVTENTRLRIVQAFESTLHLIKMPTFEMRLIPVVPCCEIADYYGKNPSNKQRKHIYTMKPVSEQAFAVHIQEGCHYPQYKNGDMIVIDPAQQICDGDYVLVKFAEFEVKEYHISGDEVRLVDLRMGQPSLVFNRLDVEAVTIIGRVVGLWREQ